MTYSNQNERHPRLLGIFAHPDDESYCAGGTFAKYATEGAEIMVISATPGDAGQIRDAAVATRRTLGQVRAQELQAACRELGVQHAVCWEYPDGTLKDMDPEILIARVVETIRSFRPDVVITFGEDGAYGHPDHIAISTATTLACQRAGDATQYPSQLAGGVAPYSPARLYHSHFPRSGLLFLEHLVQWLVSHDRRFRGSFDFVRGILLLSEETTALRYTSDYFDVNWYPPGFYIVEQGEPATSLYLILSGRVEAVREDRDGTLRPLEQLGPGTFFGEMGLATKQPRNAHVIAVESTTCLVFSPGQPTAFAGRGESANQELALSSGGDGVRQPGGATTMMDVRDFVDRKIRAIASHRTQYPLEPGMLPLSMLQDMMGREYFVRVYPPFEMETSLLSV